MSEKPRMSATVQYCQPYIRPIENQILAVDYRKLDEIDQRIVGMMGYRVMAPFMGYGELCVRAINISLSYCGRDV